MSEAPQLPKGYGQVAFEAYVAKGTELGEFFVPPPSWWGLSERHRMAWDAAADASFAYISKVPG